MQLRRDTEYALRIMLCIAEYLKENEKMAGVRLYNVITWTGIPMISFMRVVKKLEESGLVRERYNKEGEKYLYPGKEFWKQNLISIGNATGESMDVFVIFDKKSLPQRYGSRLKEIQNKLDHVFSESTLASFVGRTE